MVRAVVVAMLLAACWSGKQDPAEPTAREEPVENRQVARRPPPPPREETPMMAMRRFTDEFCACSDAQCAQDVSDRLTKWAQDWARAHENDEESRRMSDEDQKEATELGTRMSECMQRAMTTGSSTP